MQEVQAPSWEVQVSIQTHVASNFCAGSSSMHAWAGAWARLQAARMSRGMCKVAGSTHDYGRRQGCRQHA